MNYLERNFEWLKSVTDETTLFNILYDPLYAIRRQIENEEFRLRKMGYLQKRIICGLDMKANRIRTLISNNLQSGKLNSIRYFGDESKYDLSDKYLTQEFYKIWVKI